MHNTNLPYFVSANWRLDFYKFKNLSCAEVLKLAIKKDRVNSGIQHTSEANTTFHPVKPNVHRVCTKTVPLRLSSPAVKTKGQRVIRNTKVSGPNMGIQTQNRFHILQGVDDLPQP